MKFLVGLLGAVMIGLSTFGWSTPWYFPALLVLGICALSAWTYWEIKEIVR